MDGESLLTGREAVALWRDVESGLGRVKPVSWGLPFLDAAVGKLVPGATVVVAGRTNAGKSFVQLAMAGGSGEPGLYMSLEDRAHEVGRRLSYFADDALDRFIIVCPLRARLSAIRAKAHEAAAKYKPRMMFVDYLQKVRYDGDIPVFSKLDQVAANIAELQAIAGEIDCVLVLGSQLRRPAPGEDPAPQLWQLRDSSDIENCADYVVLLQGLDAKTLRIQLAKSKTSEVGAECLFKRGAGGKLEEMSSIDFD